ncbi:MAG: hypothetical protein IT204_25035 [Fimbriimonadaceae bacterium]|nr:hypothetical protein [Fimbriimonadaceae bacterium]
MNGEWRDRLLGYDDRHLDAGEREELERLLDSEPQAREFLAALRADRDRFREAYGSIQARPGFTAAVMQRLPQRQPRWLPIPRLLEVLAAGLMVFVLATLISPARRAEQQRLLVCQREVRDLSRAFLSYTEDFDGRLPDSQRWVQQVAEYRQTPTAAHCPADPRPDVAVSYAMPVGLSAADVARLRPPQSQVLLFDANGLFPAPRHDRAANFGFLDGSVRTLSEGEAQVVGWEP